MYVNLSSEFSEVIARAFAGGVETSIEQLAIVIGVDDLPRLLAARRVIDMVHRLKLELAPSEEVLEFNSLRVLRPAASAGTSSNRIGSLIAAGECASIEFKSSMLCSMRDWRDSSKLVEFPSLQGEILKTVCAFLNTEGGDLLVGVDDDGKSCDGIELDMRLRKWNLDKWQLHFHSLIKDRFHEGVQVQPYLTCEMTAYGPGHVFHVSVMPRTARSFVQRERGRPYEFFMRNGPRTDSLDLPTFYSHMISR